MPSTSIPGKSQVVTLRRWRIIEVEGKDGNRSRHVWGHDVTHDQGRASSSIVKFDVETMTATTRSGTNYRLTGLPGNSRYGKHVWEKWCIAFGVVAESDVTDEYLNTALQRPEVFAKLNGLGASDGTGGGDDGDLTIIALRDR